MKIVKVILLSSVVTLSACSSQNTTKGVGFTGIGSEASYSAPQSATGYAYKPLGGGSVAQTSSAAATVPQHSYGDASASQKISKSTLERRINEAINKAGKRKTTATSVTVNGKERRLSRISVDGTEIGVVTPANGQLIPRPFSRDDLKVINEKMSAWTGCIKGKGVYSRKINYGVIVGVAAVLNCG
ncbi:hypothetical protein [Roseovarius sp. EL26]|uniref:hypothetical protein n=1 Tax=Roseovarius sp. EL26 TaxID=2126672 RepID=UPI0013C4E2B1|nr:hypothetical protein [Roseovarius sp. EL26]